MIFYTDMEVNSRADLARKLADPDLSTVHMVGIGICLILIACAKTGETTLESRDLLRNLIAHMEADLFRGWDELRRIK